MANIEVELILFNYEIDIEAKTELFEYKVLFTNKSSFALKGGPSITYKATNSEFIYTEGKGNPCPTLQPNETCILSSKEKNEYNPNLYGAEGFPDLVFISAQYWLTED